MNIIFYIQLLYEDIYFKEKISRCKDKDEAVWTVRRWVLKEAI